MEKLNFDTGIKEFSINGGAALRFNPGDPNVYARFLDALEEIRAVEEQLISQAREPEAENREETGAQALRLIVLADRKTKDILSRVFGGENDFHAILGGVNLLAVAGNGRRVITNLLEALQPILVAGAESCARQQADSAVEQAKQNRAQRRAQK